MASGSHGTDIASIPSIALKRVEVLRDGAGAQYGSDAVAGVLNFVLRDAPEGGSLETNLGQYYHGDGDRLNVAANIGLPLTEAGFANLSFEFTNADSTNRSVQRDDARRMIEHGNAFIRRSAAQPWGAPDVTYDYKFFGNLGLDLGTRPPGCMPSAITPSASLKTPFTGAIRPVFPACSPRATSCWSPTCLRTRCPATARQSWPVIMSHKVRPPWSR